MRQHTNNSFYKFLIPLFALSILFMGCTPKEKDSPTNDMPETQGSEQFGFDGKMLSGTHQVILHTSKGDIVLELYADEASKTVTNFVVLSKVGYYNDLIFHRVIPGFMIQGGDPNGDGTGGKSVFGDKFEDEINDLKMVRGVIAMANSGPNTNGSQFFIMHGPAAPWLDGKHTVFGKVTDGMDVVDMIMESELNERDMPVDPVTFTVEVVE